MARQTGPLKYKGNIGGVRHFKIKGLKGSFAGMAGGASAEQIKTAPEFKRTRENMNEFAGCATAGKSVRVGLSSLMQTMSDSRLTGRLTAIMKKINLEDQSEARGQRAILISEQTQYLKGLVFNKSVNFNSMFTGSVRMTPTASRTGVNAIISYNLSTNINAPLGATHFRLVLAVSAISDFIYNADTKMYEPANPTLNEKSTVSYMPEIAIGGGGSITSNQDCQLPSSITSLTDDTSLIACVGIEFLQQVSGNYYLLSSGNALKIVDIF